MEARFTSMQIPLQVAGGDVLQATLRLPEGGSPERKLPVLLIFGGFESAAQVLDLIHPEAPVALASFDYPFTASRKFELPSALMALPEIKRVFPKTLEGISGLIRLLKERPEIDPDRIVVIGASFGAPFAVAAAAENPDIDGVAIVHGFGQVPETAESAILKTWLPKYGWIARPSAWVLSRGLWLFLNIDSPESFARRLRSHQRVLMVNAAFDSRIPREATESLWSAVRESPAYAVREDLPSDHLMPGSNSLIQKIMGRVRRWMSWRSLEGSAA